MATSEERREVAASMRAVAGGPEVATLSFGEMMNSVLTGGAPRPTDYREMFRCIADLIDPTCQMKSIPKSSYRVCSRCGAFVRRDAVTSCTEVIPVRHCPNCGARVVSGDVDQR